MTENITEDTPTEPLARALHLIDAILASPWFQQPGRTNWITDEQLAGWHQEADKIREAAADGEDPDEQRERVARVLRPYLPCMNGNLRRRVALEAADDAIAALAATEGDETGHRHFGGRISHG